ncbi:hypothetical protein AAFG07_33095 [Bradyrhizobium sp. B097]|uniref:hypothetical protein n=1 Tax=Bradyrhizobium sp. B097 TaxID=3140244 RepID=UPI00318448D5
MRIIDEPSSSRSASVVFVGRNRHGRWVAWEQNGRFGGLFVNRAAAFKFALLKNGHYPENIVELPPEIELEIHRQNPLCDGRNLTGGR